MHLLPSTSRLLLPDQKNVYFTSRLDVSSQQDVSDLESIYHLSFTFIFWAWSFSDLLLQPQPATGRGHELTKRECKWINEWWGGTNESFMCCSSARLTLSNYLASAFNGGVSKWDKSALAREILKDLGVRDKLTEWVLMSLLRPPRSHTQLGTQAWCILSEDTHADERFFFPFTNMQSMSSLDLQDGTVHIIQPGQGCVKKNIQNKWIIHWAAHVSWPLINTADQLIRSVCKAVEPTVETETTEESGWTFWKAHRQTRRHTRGAVLRETVDSCLNTPAAVTHLSAL